MVSPEVFLTISLYAAQLVYWDFCMGIVFGEVGSVGGRGEGSLIFQETQYLRDSREF